ncbi:MAG: endonuclease III domain-containing protein [Syntrophobacteria bacterium]
MLAEQIAKVLAATYGITPWNWHTRQSPFQVLIGTLLSQRTRDGKTDEAARALFSRYPTAEKLASARIEEIARLIRPVNFYVTKAQRIKELCMILVEKHSGKTPESIAALMELPGVGRKTACCVRLYGFGKPALPVDTHVHRISNRIGLVRTTTPDETERKLWEVVPEQYIMLYNQLLVRHGQKVCRPVGPRCQGCPIVGLCAYGSSRNRSK